MSKKIHFNNFDLPTVDKSVLPHMVYNLNGNEYYVKTKKAENSDKKVGVGCLKFGDYEWLIKNSWGLVLPADCSWYIQNNYPNTYNTMKVLPNELQTADASNVTNMHGMFYDCTNLKTIPLLDTSKVFDMSYMFNECKSLTTIPQLDTSKVTDMNSMFIKCTNLTTVSQLNTSKATNMYEMFLDCAQLTTIPQLDTSKVTDMYGMFYNCTSLPTKFTWTIDCSSINSIDDIKYIFAGSSVTTVTFKNVKEELKPLFTAANLGSQLTKITIQNTIA